MPYSDSNDPENCNVQVAPKRVLKSDKKLSYLRMRNNNGTIKAIFEPPEEIPEQKSNASICNLEPDEVTKTTSNIKFGNRPHTSSRFHNKCFNSKPKPKYKKNIVKRNIATESCAECSCSSKKGKKFKNECYCTNPLKKPMLPGVPEFTVPYEDGVFRSSLAPAAYRPETLKIAKDIIDYIPQSEFLARIYRENCSNCMCSACVLRAANTSLKYTKRRLNLEEAYNNMAGTNRINFDKLSHLKSVNIPPIEPEKNQEIKGKKSPTRNEKKSAVQPEKKKPVVKNKFEKSNESISPTSTPKTLSPKSGRSNSPASTLKSVSPKSGRSINTTTEKKINAVKNIRKENYFETHSTENKPKQGVSNSPPKEHKCIFKYTTDDRGLLKPLNPDAYGTNRCSICNKAQPEESPNFKHNEKKKITSSEVNKNIQNQDTQTSKHTDVDKNLKITQSKNTQTSKHKQVKTSNVVQAYNMQLSEMNSAFPKKYSQPSPKTPIVDKKTPKKFHESVPLKICNPSKEKTVQLNLKDSIINNTRQHKIKSKNIPANSWALRYQKGVK